MPDTEEFWWINWVNFLLMLSASFRRGADSKKDLTWKDVVSSMASKLFTTSMEDTLLRRNGKMGQLNN